MFTEPFQEEQALSAAWRETGLALPPRGKAFHFLPWLARCLCLLSLVLTAPPATACRYNVRDLGFMELESETWQLLVLPPTNAPPTSLAALRRTAEGALRESSVRVEFVPADDPRMSNAPLAEMLKSQRRPAAALVSPDGPSLAVPLARDPPSIPALEETVLRELVTSPTRDEIVRECSRRFGVVLLIEGSDAAQNAAARRAMAEAVAEIHDSRAALPKAIAEPPGVVNLPLAALARERILLWSLGLTPEPRPEPRAAIIYGKARWIGPLMKGREIAAGNLTRLFAIVGADCECGMDLAWTRGTTLPVRWDAVAHQAATKSLGFDPLDPLVQMEAARILARFSSELAGASPAIRAADPLMTPLVASSTPTPPRRDAPGSPWRTTWLAVSLLAGGVAVGALWLWRRNQRH